MRALLPLFLICFFTGISFFGHAYETVIYGENDIFEFKEANSIFLSKMSEGLALVIDNENFDSNSFSTAEGPAYNLYVKKLGEKFNLCKNENFWDQSSIGFCTAILVNPDTVITAGHCVLNISSCLNTHFVFDYIKTQNNTDPKSSLVSNMYQCKELLYTRKDIHSPDLSVIKLDRVVLNRTPLTIASKDSMKAGSQVGTMGFPLGLPLKVTLNGTVREVFADYFQANLNSYSGNSGSPVFDINSGSVAGILVRGENDFEWNENDRCMQSKFCPMGECRGEDVFPASLINSILNTVLISPI